MHVWRPKLNESLIVDGVGKCYRPRGRREVWALRDVSFSVERGTVLGIVGPNGAGKTTLLKVLARISPPTTGRVRGRGRVVPLLALGSAFNRDLSGRENVFLNAAMYGIPAQEVTRRFDEIVEFAGLADSIDYPVKQYSSGMYLRLAFSVAINMDPEILLADEVLAVGDLEFQERCLARVAESGERGITVLFVSHDMEAISRLCSRALMLNAGELVKDGDAEEVIEMYRQAAWTKGPRSRRAKNKYSELLFVKLMSVDGSEIGAAKRTDDLYITYGLRIDRPGISVRAACDVFARGVLAFRSMQPADVLITEPGTYTASVRIPGGLLVETIYNVNAALDVRTRDGDRLPIVDRNALSFRVYDAASESTHGTWRGGKLGIVAPALEWQMVPARHETIVNG